jgi:hypothetical protein
MAELSDALAQVTAAEALRTLDDELPVSADLETEIEVRALLKKLGLAVEAPENARLTGRIPSGVRRTGRALLYERMTPVGVFLDGTKVRLGPIAQMLALWQKKLE